MLYQQIDEIKRLCFKRIVILVHQRMRFPNEYIVESFL